jgi:hypothetical protein
MCLNGNSARFVAQWNGYQNRGAVPFDLISRCPPKSFTRSRIPARPRPRFKPLCEDASRVSAGMPRPKSLTVKVVRSLSLANSIWTRVLPEWR